MKSVVTGGAGFIGSHLVDHLLARGDEVVVIDDLSSGFKENLADDQRLEFVESDISTEENLADIFDGADCIFHLAARGSVPRSIAHPLDTHNSNATGTLMVLEACREAQVGRVISASSSSIYGDNRDLPKVEGKTGRVLSPYAATKQLSETYCALFWHHYKLPVTSLRFFNVYGPRQRADHAYAAVIPRLIASGLADESISIHGDGQQTRDFTFVADNVRGIVSASEAPPSAVLGRTFNLAAGGQTTVNQIVKLVGEALGQELKFNYVDQRPGDVRHSCADIAAIKAATGFRPQLSIRDGIQLTVDSWR